MNHPRSDIVRHRMARAHEALEEARLMIDAGHGNAAMNRVYYACFYAVNALLLSRNYIAPKHAGVRAMFNRHFIKPGLISRDLGKFYGSLFESRREGDYLDMVRIDVDAVRPLLTKALELIKEVEKLIGSVQLDG